MRSFWIQKLVNIFKHLPQSLFWNLYYQNPSKDLKIIGVTGTDGKTTTVNMIYTILKESGKKVAMISTVSAKIENEEIDTGFHVTSPDNDDLQRLFNNIKQKEIEWVVLEMTSHGLDQFRFEGVKLDFAVITNITHEHLDYHKTYENYLLAKSKTISMLKKNGKAILNKDDSSYERLKEIAQRNNKEIVSYSIINESDNQALNIDIYGGHIEYKVNNERVHLNVIGKYNIYNSLAAYSVSTQFISRSIVSKALNLYKGVTGRMEVIQSSPFSVIVDFAHTPNALEQALSTLSEIKGEGELFVIFGCAGLRDRQKRKMMGKVASKYASTIFITAEDPRSEELRDINNEIVEAIEKDKRWSLYKDGENPKYKYLRFDEMSVESRVKALQKAVLMARPKDIVVAFGKGHEKSLCFYEKEYNYTDQETFKEALNKLNSI